MFIELFFLSQQCSDKHYYTRVPEFTHRLYLDCLFDGTAKGTHVCALGTSLCISWLAGA